MLLVLDLNPELLPPAAVRPIEALGSNPIRQARSGPISPRSNDPDDALGVVPIGLSGRSHDSPVCLLTAVPARIGAFFFRFFLSRSVMSSAIELIVDGYARLGDRQSLEDLRMHRRRLAVDLKSVKGFDCSRSIEQIEIDIAAIDTGLVSLSNAVG